jgi:hypothetical protein
MTKKLTKKKTLTAEGSKICKPERQVHDGDGDGDE